MGLNVEEFKELWKRFKAEGYRYPSIRAFHALVGDDYVEHVEADSYYAYCELKHRNWVLRYVDCYTVGVYTNIQLYDEESGDVVFYSGEE